MVAAAEMRAAVLTEVDSKLLATRADRRELLRPSTHSADHYRAFAIHEHVVAAKFRHKVTKSIDMSSLR
jgi:hypothetical protein